MPQLNLIDGSQTGVRFTVDYWSNPLRPDEKANLSVTIKDGHGAPIDVLFARVPNEVVHELCVEVMRATWEAWLFGTMHDTRRAFADVVAVWKKEAATRRKNSERAGDGWR